MHIYVRGKLRGSVKSDQDNFWFPHYHSLYKTTCPLAHTGAHRRTRGINPSGQALYWIIKTYYTFTAGTDQHPTVHMKKTGDAHFILKGTVSTEECKPLLTYWGPYPLTARPLDEPLREATPQTESATGTLLSYHSIYHSSFDHFFFQGISVSLFESDSWTDMTRKDGKLKAKVTP